MTAAETIASLEAQLKQALERLDEVTEQLRVAQARIEELEKLKTPPPAFVKANKKKPQEDQKKARKKRDARHNRARARSTPTQIVEHRLVTTPCYMNSVGPWTVYQGAEKMVEEVLRLTGDTASLIREQMATLPQPGR